MSLYSQLPGVCVSQVSVVDIPEPALNLYVIRLAEPTDAAVEDATKGSPYFYSGSQPECPKRERHGHSGNHRKVIFVVS